MAKKKYQISELRESDNDYQTRRRINENFKQLFSMAKDASNTIDTIVVDQKSDDGSGSDINLKPISSSWIEAL